MVVQLSFSLGINSPLLDPGIDMIQLTVKGIQFISMCSDINKAEKSIVTKRRVAWKSIVQIEKAKSFWYESMVVSIINHAAFIYIFCFKLVLVLSVCVSVLINSLTAAFTSWACKVMTTNKLKAPSTSVKKR